MNLSDSLLISAYTSDTCKKMKIKIGKKNKTTPPKNKTKQPGVGLNILELNIHGISFDTFTFSVIVFETRSLSSLRAA